MAYGTAYCYTEDLCRRFNSIRIQEKSNSRSSWPWWTHTQYNHLHFKKRRNQKPLLKNVPVPDCLERGLSAGRLTRREYKIRLLEARYSCTIGRDSAKSQEHIECSNEDVSRKSPGFILRNQSFAARVSESKAGTVATETSSSSDRRTSDDTICCRVFQSVGSDLIAPWLTPKELHYVEKAFHCTWDWGQAWHHGRVRDRSISSRVEYLLPITGVHYLIDLYGSDTVFSALWHLIRVEDFTSLAEQYKHLKSIRRLIHLRS